MKTTLFNDGVSRIVELKQGGLKLQLAMDRGNIFKSFTLNDRELILIKPENYASDDRPTCGCPVLFPYSGNNHEGKLTIGETCTETGIHGIVHTNRWVLQAADETKAEFITHSDDLTKKHFPFDFTLRSILSLTSDTLRYELIVTNESDQIMPCDFGLHPFFLISTLDQQMFSGRFKDGRLLDPSKLDLKKVCGSGYLCEALEQLRVAIKDRAVLTFENTKGFIDMLLWSGDPTRFLVIEPLSGKVNAINDHVNRFNVEPHAEARSVFKIKVEANEQHT